LVPLEEKEAIDGVKNTVVLEQWKLDPDKGSKVEIKETYIVAKVRVTGVKATALWEHHPAVWVEPSIGYTAATRGIGGRAPL
jgi:hypothetical protein